MGRDYWKVAATGLSGVVSCAVVTVCTMGIGAALGLVALLFSGFVTAHATERLQAIHFPGEGVAENEEDAV